MERGREGERIEEQLAATCPTRVSVGYDASSTPHIEGCNFVFSANCLSTTTTLSRNFARGFARLLHLDLPRCKTLQMIIAFSVAILEMRWMTRLWQGPSTSTRLFRRPRYVLLDCISPTTSSHKTHTGVSDLEKCTARHDIEVPALLIQWQFLVVMRVESASGETHPTSLVYGR